MKNEGKIKFKIEQKVLTNYVEAINLIKEPMKYIKENINQISSSEQVRKMNKQPTIEQFKSINAMSDTIKNFSNAYTHEKMRIFTDTIKQIMETNSGMLTTRMIEPLNISRQYLSIMEKNNIIEKISRGIYISSNTFEDSYFSFQQKYKKAIFSHMNALYFYGMTEEFPYNYTVTVPQRYHVDTVNDKCNVFYVKDDIYEMGVTEVKTPSGNKVRVYDKERCICDIVRSKGRMDTEQVKKTIKKYIQSNSKDMAKLSEYSKIMGINKKVMEMVDGSYYE